VIQGDFTGDGVPDLAESGANPPSVSVWVGQPDGTYSGPLTSTLTFQPLETAFTLRSGDFNEDGRLDLVLRMRPLYDSQIAQSALLLLLGDGSGRFAEKSRTVLGQFGLAHEVGDYDGDGNLDVAVILRSLNVLRVLRGDGAGGLQAQPDLSLGSQAEQLFTGRFNGDAADDLLVRLSGPCAARVILGNAGGPLTLGNAYPATVQAMQPLGLAGDGFSDFGYVQGSQLTVLDCDGQGGFSVTTEAVADTVGLPVRADFNRDGALDLAVLVSGSSSGSFLTLYLNQGGTLQAVGTTHVRAVSYTESGFAVPGGGSSWGSPVAVKAMDLNCDGWTDVVVQDPRAGLQLLTTDGQGQVEGPTRLPVADPIQADSGITADFNGDGHADVLGLSYSGADRALLYLGDGAGGLTLSAAVALPRRGPLAAADVTGDGCLDACVGGSSSQLLVLAGDGAGNLATATAYANSSGCTRIMAANLNGDAIADLIVSGSSTIALFTGGTFTRTTLNSQALVASGDFTGDGLADLVVTRATGPRLLVNGGTGVTFVEGSVFTPSLDSLGAAADLDADGFLDLAAQSGSSLRIFKGDGAGGLTATGVLSTGPVTSVGAASVTADTLPDLLVTMGEGAVGLAVNSGAGEFAAPQWFGVVGGGPMVANFVSGGVAELMTSNREGFFLTRVRP